MSWFQASFGYSDSPRYDVFGVGGAVQGAATIAGAGIQSAAVNRATDAQARSAQNALDFQRQQWSTQQDQQAPYVATGQQNVGTLNDLVNNGSLGQQYGQSYSNPDFSGSYNPSDFNPTDTQTAAFDPNSVHVQQDAGYQFRLDQGLESMRKSLAATGVSGGALAKAMNDYAQGTASQEYGNAYNRALQSYQTNAAVNQQNYGQQAQTYGVNNQNALNRYNTGLQTYNTNTANHANQYATNYNTWNTDNTNQFNRRAALAGIGQTAVSQLGASGNQVAQNVGNLATQQGNAYAAGSAAQGNIWGNATSSLGGLGSQYLLYRGLQQHSGYNPNAYYPATDEDA
jgi:hypothetical protein